MAKGFVYILTNPEYKGYVKIGYSNDVNRRIQDLSRQTGVMSPFKLYASCQTCKYKELEQLIHHVMDITGKRKDPHKEFFLISPSEALKELRFLAKSFEDAVIEAPGEVQTISSHAPSFRFSMVHLKHGDELIFWPTGAIVKVFEQPTDNKVQFEGKIYSLNQFCKVYMPARKRNRHKSYRGPRYFSHNGILLTKLRAKYENRNSQIA